MISSAVLVAITGTLVAAQSSTVVNLMLPAVDPQDLVASVIDASPEVTTYAVECADEKKAGADCGLLHAQTVAQGPSTWSIHYSHSDPDYGSYEQDMWCDIDSRKDTIMCTVSMVEEYDGTTGTTTTTAATTGIGSLFIPVTVTAGLDKLAPGATSDVAAATETSDAEASTTADSASSTDSDDEAEPTTTDAEPTTTAADDDEQTESEDSQPTTSPAITSLFTSTTSSPSTPTSTPTTTDTDNAAFPKATQNAFLVGVAVVVGGVMML
jgi:hypothetical protein